MDELQQQIDDLQSQLDDSNNQIQENSNTSVDHEQRISNVEKTSGQLEIPLDPDTVVAINQAMGFAALIGSVQLSGGLATINSNFILSTSIIFLSRGQGGPTLTDSGGTGFFPGLAINAQSDGSFTISSGIISDTGFVNYLVINNQ